MISTRPAFAWRRHRAASAARHRFTSLCGFMLAIGMTFDSLLAATVTCEPTQYREHANAWRLSNGTVEVVVVPALGGRILHFGFAGGPNLLWETTNVAEESKRLGGWPNHGGDKAWVWPQEQWAAPTGQAWPPPAEFDQAAYSFTLTKDGHVELISPVLPRFGNHRLLRKISMPAGGSSVVIDTHLLPSDKAPPDPATTGQQWAAWQITQTPRFEFCLIAVGRGADNLQNGSATPGECWAADIIGVADERFAVLRPPADAVKRKVTADAKAMANVTGDTLFVQTWRPVDAAGEIAPDPQRCQLYIDTTPATPGDQYLEMEWIAPPTQSQADRSGMRVTWTLQRLSKDQRTPDAAAKLMTNLFPRQEP